MSRNISPPSRPRSKKITGGRVACTVYLPKQEVDQIDQIVDQDDSSRSQVIARIYYQGKNKNNEPQEG